MAEISSGPPSQGLRSQQIAVIPAMHQTRRDGNISTGEGVCHFSHCYAVSLQSVAVKGYGNLAPVTAKHLGLGHAGNGKQTIPQLIFGQAAYLSQIQFCSSSRGKCQNHQRLGSISNFKDEGIMDAGREYAFYTPQFSCHLIGSYINIIIIFKFNLNSRDLILGGGSNTAYTVN